ncbi:MAG: hypothetical protein B7Z27_02910 [Sphingobacteriia bacterium 32-37-4]|nr:MAG: hypothetical protein B7Z27_02910 [Sphingobacteriia bacterium 32-37-4]
MSPRIIFSSSIAAFTPCISGGMNLTPLGMFDLIFIDAAKSQYQTFFNKYERYLKKGGYIICDNLHFHHLTPDKVNRHTQALLRKIKNFKTFLAEHPHAAASENLIIWEMEPTAENILLYIRNVLLAELPTEIRLRKLKIYETSDSYAEWLN